MPAQSGQCPNFGNCNKADDREIILIQPGTEFRCPECNSTLRPVQVKVSLPLRAIVLGVAGVLAVGGGLYWGIGAGRGHTTPAAPPPAPGAATAAEPSLAPAAAEPFPPLTAAAWTQLIARVRGQLVDDPIIFGQGQTRISEEDQNAIRDSLPKLDHYPRSRILVEAHVDRSDSPPEDQKLSDQRALEVKRFLTDECGIPDNRIFAKGCGSDQLPERAPGENEQEWKRRARRVKIFIVGE